MNISFPFLSRRWLMGAGVFAGAAAVALAAVWLFPSSGGEHVSTGDIGTPETALVRIIERDITTLREELKNPFYAMLRRFEPEKDTARPGKANPFVE